MNPCGGFTHTIFSLVEELLLDEEADYFRALQFVSARKKMNRYHSTLDFFFCELYPEWRCVCVWYYRDECPSLMDMLTVESATEFEKKLIMALEVAHRLFREQRCESWDWYREQVEKSLKAAT